MPSVYKKRYDEEFKRNAVDLLVHSDKPVRVLARELGVCEKTLRDWRERILGPMESADRAPRGEGGATMRELAEENRRLRRDLERVIRQRDILKKAMGICSETSPGGMP